jgi:4-hydroxythreonine-4-phosphate dehydrogenase
MPKPVIGITLGDPAGIGPEIIAKALRHPRIHSLCRPIVFGSIRFLEEFSAGLEFVRASQPFKAGLKKGKIPVVDVRTAGRIRTGSPSAASGKAALAYLDQAIKCAVSGEIDAMVTAPLSKAAVRLAGISDFTGHTEYLAKRTGARSFAMMFYGRRLIVSLVTTHLPLRRVAQSLKEEKIIDVITLSHDAAQRLGRPNPRVGVAGLNPHAGEGGALGKEDMQVVAPAVGTARKRGMRVEGPIPADVLFRKAYQGEFDVVVAMYHDQALAPFKMISFERGVNVTLGLPFVRTSVDHGTAFDIAGKGIASEKSMVEAIRLAARLAR